MYLINCILNIFDIITKNIQCIFLNKNGIQAVIFAGTPSMSLSSIKFYLPAKVVNFPPVHRKCPFYTSFSILENTVVADEKYFNSIFHNNK